MNVNIYNTTDYENISDWTLGENKPNSNPIKPNSRKAKMKKKEVQMICHNLLLTMKMQKSGRRDSNPRRPAWEADILPLNYARNYFIFKDLQQTACWQSQFCAGLCRLIHSLHSNSMEYILIREDLPAFFPEGHTSILDSFQSFVFIYPDRSIVMMRISNKVSQKRNDFRSSRYIESRSFCEINMLVRELLCRADIADALPS